MYELLRIPWDECTFAEQCAKALIACLVAQTIALVSLGVAVCVSLIIAFVS